MTKKRTFETLKDDFGEYCRVPIGDNGKHGFCLIDATDMATLQRKYGDKSFFLSNRRKNVCIKWMNKNRPIARLLLYTNSLHTVIYKDNDSLNIRRHNIKLRKLTSSKDNVVVRRADHISTAHYVDPETSRLFDNENFKIEKPIYLGNIQEPKGLTNEDRHKAIDDLCRRYFKAADTRYKEELFNNLITAYGMLFRCNPTKQTLVRVLSDYKERMNIAA